MVRVRIVGGKLTADQFLACHELARTLGNGTLRITTRQEFQLHGVLEETTWRRRSGGSTRRCSRPWPPAATWSGTSCAAPRRFTMHSATSFKTTPAAGPPTPRPGPRATGKSGSTARRSRPCRRPVRPRCRPRPTTRSSRSTARRTCRASSRRPSPSRKTTAPTFMPTTSATWRSSRTAGSSATTCWSAAAWARPRAPRRRSRSWPSRSATSIGRRSLEIGEAVLKVFRDFGNRSDRKRARLKYIIHDWGLPAFRAKIEEYLGHPLAEARGRSPSPTSTTTWAGTSRATASSSWASRSRTAGSRTTARSGSSAGCVRSSRSTGCPARLTCQQSILLADLDPAWRAEINAWLEEYGIATVERISTVRRWSMACPALPTCGLAVTEAERALPSVLDELEAELARLGLAQERLTVRMTGCPNGCARPYNADIGLVGRSAHIGPDGKPGPGHLHDLPGRPHDRRPAQPRVQGLRPPRPGRGRAGPGLRAIQGATAERRDVRRVLRSTRRRGACRPSRCSS